MLGLPQPQTLGCKALQLSPGVLKSSWCFPCKAVQLQDLQEGELLGQASAALPVARTLSVPVARRPWKALHLENSLGRPRDALKLQEQEGEFRSRHGFLPACAQSTQPEFQ